MNRVLRILMMFGPMLYKQYQKYQQRKSAKQSAQNFNKQVGHEQPQTNPKNEGGDFS